MFSILKAFSVIFILSVSIRNTTPGGASSLSGTNTSKETVNARAFSSKLQQSEQKPAISGLVVSMRETFNDVDELIRSIIQSLSSYVPQITTDLKELLTKMISHMSNALEEFRSGVLDAGKLLLRDTVRSMHQQLLQFKEEFQSLAFMADQQFNRVVDHFNNTLINQTENIDLWAANLKQELRSVNNSRLYKEGCQVLDAFMQQTTDELRNCCNIAVKPVLSLCRGVRNVLAEALNVLADALERMQTCLEDKNSYLEYMLPCIHVAYDDVNALIARSAQLRHNITTMMPMKIVFSKFCILIVSVHIEQRQSRVEQEIDAHMDMKHTTKYRNS